MFSSVLLSESSPATIGLKPTVPTNSLTVSSASSSSPAIKASTCLPSITGAAKSAAKVVLKAFMTFEFGRNLYNSSAELVSGEVTNPVYVSFSGLAIEMTIF